MMGFFRARAPWLIPSISVFYFVLAGLALIPWPGLQNDELFFAGPLYDRNAAFYYAQCGSIRLPLMLVSYTGALKTWLYAGLLAAVEPSPWTIRLPSLLMGALTLWLTWIWMRRIGAGVRSSAITIVLLATDTSYLITDTFDWGPVAIQHLLLMSGLVALQVWVARESRGALALAFFLWGLGLWDKMLMLWPLSGLAMASIVVYRREVMRRMCLKNAGIAFACFLVGASPLIWYNIARRGETATRNIVVSVSNLPLKLKALRETIDGSSMFGFIVEDKGFSGLHPATPRLALLPVAIKKLVGTHKRSYMPFAFGLASLCFVVLLRSSSDGLPLFLGIATVVGWLAMILNKGTGVFVHHVILLWPLPLAFVGAALGRASERLVRAGQALVVIIVIFLVVGNMLTTNEYLADFVTHGGMGGWTDAIYTLSQAVDNTEAQWIGLVDWGYLNGLRVLKKREVGLFGAGDTIGSDHFGPADREAVRHMASTPGVLFVQHVEGKQITAGVNDRFRRLALQVGYKEHLKQVVADSDGRPIFELFSLAKE